MGRRNLMSVDTARTGMKGIQPLLQPTVPRRPPLLVVRALQCPKAERAQLQEVR